MDDKRSHTIEEFADRIIEKLIFARYGKHQPLDFPGAPSFDTALTPLAEITEDDDRWFFAPREMTPAVLWPFDSCAVQTQYLEVEHEWNLFRVCTCPPALARNRVTITPRHIVMFRTGYLNTETGKLEVETRLAGWIANRYMFIDKGIAREGRWAIRDDARQDLAVDDAVRMHHSIAFRHRYLWHVAVGIEGRYAVSFETDPTGSMEIFKDRDLPEGKSRRAALRNWVGQHWRKRRTNPEADIFVKKHLRGAVRFNWRGFDCHVTPPQYEIEQLVKTQRG
jgi:hypothetical protein